MWSKGEKSQIIGLGYCIFGCVTTGSIASVALLTVGLVYFGFSIYYFLKGE